MLLLNTRWERKEKTSLLSLLISCREQVKFNCYLRLWNSLNLGLFFRFVLHLYSSDIFVHTSLLLSPVWRIFSSSVDTFLNHTVSPSKYFCRLHEFYAKRRRMKRRRRRRRRNVVVQLQLTERRNDLTLMGSFFLLCDRWSAVSRNNLTNDSVTLLTVMCIKWINLT